MPFFFLSVEFIIWDLAECYVDHLLTHLVEVVCRTADLDLCCVFSLQWSPLGTW